LRNFRRPGAEVEGDAQKQGRRRQQIGAVGLEFQKQCPATQTEQGESDRTEQQIDAAMPDANAPALKSLPAFSVVTISSKRFRAPDENG
jgi:hypothetical protein